MMTFTISNYCSLIEKYITKEPDRDSHATAAFDADVSFTLKFRWNHKAADSMFLSMLSKINS